MYQENVTHRIILLLDSRGFGGIESHVLQLARALQQDDHPVSVVLLRDYGPHPLREALTKQGITVVALRHPIELLKLFLSRPKLVHSHGYKAGILSRMMGKATRTPVISSYHAGEPGRGRVYLYNLIDRISAPLAPAIAVSDKIATSLPCQSDVVANFVTLPHKRLDPRPHKTNHSVAFVGRLCHDKGPDLFCQLAEITSTVEFELFGDGPDRTVLQQHYGRQVQFHGAVSSMDGYWNQIGLLCISSRHEGLPLTALEAMAQGIPVAAFDVGDLSKLIEHRVNGWLIEAGDLTEMARSVQCWQQLSSQQRLQMSNQARQTIEDRYSPESVLPQMLDLYQQAAKPPVRYRQG